MNQNKISILNNWALNQKSIYLVNRKIEFFLYQKSIEKNHNLSRGPNEVTICCVSIQHAFRCCCCGGGGFCFVSFKAVEGQENWVVAHILKRQL